METTQQDIAELLSVIAMVPTLVVVFGSKENPELIVRHMPTAGGIQWCVKEVSFRGEGSGAYFAVHQQEEAAKYIHEQAERKIESGKRFAEKFNRPTVKREFLLTKDFHTEAPHAHGIEEDPLFKDATVITLG